ncbi:unnamed protein product [Caenorhabditis bovis]|uniref:Uncharacterized protein n=1 Tax=Caenorhabditis bovis TaxID=2654633 RepID=A0A8S1F2X7_9PELO|nr:unnamed protein product [Caenorhabditis bovis]
MVEDGNSQTISLDEMFKNRYSMENEAYRKISEGFKDPIIVHPWKPRDQQRGFNNRGNYQGGGGHKRKNYGGNYPNNYDKRRRGNWNSGQSCFSKINLKDLMIEATIRIVIDNEALILLTISTAMVSFIRCAFPESATNLMVY